MPVPIQQAGYNADFMGFGVEENVIPLNNYAQMLNEPFINSTPVPYPKGERLAEGEVNRLEDEEQYLNVDADTQEDTYYDRAVNYMASQSRSLLDVNNDGVIDSGDIKALASNVAQPIRDAGSATASAVKEQISDIGAESIKKSGAIEEAKVESEKAMVILREKTDLALTKVDDVANSVDARLTDVNRTLMVGFGAIAVAYIIFSRD